MKHQWLHTTLEDFRLVSLSSQQPGTVGFCIFAQDTPVHPLVACLGVSEAYTDWRHEFQEREQDSSMKKERGSHQLVAKNMT